MLSLAELERMVAAGPDGDVDTVIVAFADMQGRLVGKRVSASDFVDGVASHGAECCNYLLAVDVEMNTVPGYAMSSWDTGYGDMEMAPDLDTLRLVPWLPATALVIADCAGATAARSPPRRAASCAASSTGSTATGWRPTSPPNSSSWSSTTPTGRHGPAVIAG